MSSECANSAEAPIRTQGGDRAFAFASGMAALGAVVRLAGAGQHIIAGDDLYGGTSRLLQRVAPGLGIQVSNVDMTDPRYLLVQLELGNMHAVEPV